MINIKNDQDKILVMLVINIVSRIRDFNFKGSKKIILPKRINLFGFWQK